MAFSHTWGKNNGDMYFHYGDGSLQDKGTTLVGCYGDGTKYGQVLFLDTGDNGGVGFTFKWYPVAFSNGVDWGEGNGNRDVYCRITTAGQYEGCTNSSSNAIHMSALSGGGYGCTNTSYIFKPNTRYYIYINRSFYNGGYHHYASDNSGWGSASITFSNELLYTLNMNTGENTTIQVERLSSPVDEAATGVLSNGATIYYNDVLKVTFSASDGCDIGTHTVNGSTFTSGETITVTGNVSVVSDASVKYFTLSIKPDEGSTIIVSRSNSPLQGASIGNIDNGATIYYNDVLKITTSSSEIYEILEQTLNNNSFSSGHSHTVKGNVDIATVTRMRGITHIDNGEEVEMYLVYIYDDDGWSIYIPYIDNGSSWDICG